MWPIKGNENSNKNLKNFWGPFCCWVALRRKRREKIKNKKKLKLNNNNKYYFNNNYLIIKEEEEEREKINNNNKLFGIQINSPKEYYNFIEKYFNWGQQNNKIILFNNKEENKNDCWDCCTCPGIPSTSNNYPQLCNQLTVCIPKKFGEQLGIGIAGGSDKPIPPTISYLKPGYTAHRCDLIQVGDRLIEVNGIKVNKELTHSKVLSLLRNSGGNLLELKLEYNLNNNLQILSNKNERILTKTTEIELLDEMSSEEGDYGLFGILIRGGAFGPDITKNRPITINSIRVGSPAHREGRIRPGDRILAINGIYVNDSTLSDAINLIKTSPLPKLNLTIEYDIFNLDFRNKIKNSLKLELEKIPGINFGIELAIKQLPIWPSGSRRAIIVNRIIPASIAERCGLIHQNDELLEIDLINLKLINNLNEAYQLLNSHSSIIRIELLPAELRGKIFLEKEMKEEEEEEEEERNNYNK